MSVYFVRCGQHIKIGYSVDPKRRIRNLPYSVILPADFNHAAELEVLRVIDGGFDVESALHKRFHHLRVAGEWFNATPELIRDIEDLDGIDSTAPAPPLRLLSVAHAAAFLQRPKAFVYGLIAAGELRAIEIKATGRKPKTRVRSDDLQAFIEANTRQAG